MYFIYTFISIFSVFISSGHQQELSFPQNGERRNNQDNNHWPVQTMHTVQGNFYGQARKLHAKPCPRRRNFQNSDGAPRFTSSITKALLVNDNNNLKPQSLQEVNAKSDPNIANEISKVNQELYSKPPPNNYSDLKSRSFLSLNNEEEYSYEQGLNEDVFVPESVVTNHVLRNNNDHETSVEKDEVSRNINNDVSEPDSLQEEDFKNPNYGIPSSKETDRNFENILIESSENEDNIARNQETVETNEPELLSRSGIVLEDEEPFPEANINDKISREHCPHKSDTMDKINEPSRRFFSRPDSPTVVYKKQNEESYKPEIKSQVDKTAVRDMPKEEIDLNVEEQDNTLRSQFNQQPSGDQLEPTRGLGISNMKESRVMLMKNTRVCYACSTIDNPSCWAPNRRTTVKYCRKEHNACVTKTFVGANSLIMVRDCGNTCNDPGITGLIPKYKSCSICHSDLCNGAYSVNSHNLMIVLFLMSLAKFAF